MTEAGNTLTLETTKGNVEIKLRPDLAPNHVARIKQFVSEGFYDGIVFHRVHRRFHGADRLPARHRHGRLEIPQSQRRNSTTRRMCAAPARWRGPRSQDTANSQFFICFEDASFLDRQYTVWGEWSRAWRMSTRSSAASR